MILDALDIVQGGHGTQNESLNDKCSALILWKVPQLFTFCELWLLSKYTSDREL